MAVADSQTPDAGSRANGTGDILVGEGNRAVASALRRILEGANHRVRVTADPDEAFEEVRTCAPDVFMAGVNTFDGESACRAAKEARPDCPVVLIYPPEVSDAESRAADAGADAYLVGPLRRGSVLSCVKGMLRVRDLTRQVVALETEMERRRLLGSPVGAAGAYEFEFLRRLLMLEVRRSRRYKYPVAFLLASVDGYRAATANMSARAAGRFLGGLLGLVTRTVRDIDIAMLYAEGKFLVFMPHTSAAGARRLGERLREQFANREGGPRVTVSIGITAYDGGGDVSFGALLRKATAAARRARIVGGNRVEEA